MSEDAEFVATIVRGAVVEELGRKLFVAMWPTPSMTEEGCCA